MDCRTARTRPHRALARPTSIGAALLVAVATVLLATTGPGHAEKSSAKPKPEVARVDLTAAPVPVSAGWEGQVGTDANLVGVEWDGDQSAKFTFEVRDGQGEWQRAAQTPVFDNGPDPRSQDATHGATPATKHVTEPVWVGRDVTGVRVRIDEGTAQDVTLHVVDSTRGKKPTPNVEATGTPAAPTTETAPTTASPPPPSGPTPSIPGSSSGESSNSTTATPPVSLAQGIGQGLAATALASLVIAFIVRRRRVLAIVVVAVVALAACAPVKGGRASSPPIPDGIVSRQSWGGDLDWNWAACPSGPEYTWVGSAIVHHTVNSNHYGPSDSVGMIRGIWAYHVQSLGYCDIAYNFIIDNYGTPFEGRRGGIDQPVLGAHSLNHNQGTTGIAILGTFNDVPPSGATEGTLADLIRWKFQIHGVNPFDEDAAHIYGHRDVYPTECPGQALYDDLPNIRWAVKARW